MKDFFHIVSNVIFKPGEFFKKIEREGIKRPFTYLILFAVFTQFFIVWNFLSNHYQFPYEKFNLPAVNLEIAFTWQNFLLVYVAAIVWVVFFSFFRPAITHFFVKLYNRKATYKNTYKAVVYSDTPCYLVTPFYLIAVALLFVMLFTGLKGWLLVLFIVSCFFWIGSDIYGIYLKLLAFKKLHGISMWRGFLCLYVFTWVVLIAVIFVFDLIAILIMMSTGML
jgi:hypothetical protein